ncbi:MAG: GGDEF domain-containing protein [Desulfovibrio sp.]
MSKYNSYIKLITWLVLAFFLPLAGGGVALGVYEYKQGMRDLNRFLNHTTIELARSVSEPLYYFHPQEVTRNVRLLASDERIGEIHIYSERFHMDMAHISIAERQTGTMYTKKQFVFHEGKPIGYVKISVSNAQMKAVLSEYFNMSLGVFLLMFLCGLGIMLPVFNRLIIMPVRTLVGQAKMVTMNNLDEPFHWTGDDDFAILGKTFERMRQSLSRRFKEVEEQARTDSLTGIANRRDFEDSALRMLENSVPCSSPLSIILFDIDDFKSINDTYGHPVGDEVLKEIAALIRLNIRDSDLFARWGGEEFILAITTGRLVAVNAIADKLREMIEFGVFSSKELSITCSFGIATSMDEDRLTDLIHRADKALYEAKSKGKNTVCCS